MLIVSDIDGTLLPYGATELDAGLFPLIARLRRQGVLFCPASGRQFHSLRQLFAPVAEELGFLCENGAIIYGPGTEEDAPVLSKITMPREDALALTEDMLRLVSRRVIISGANSLYTVTGCGEDFLDMVRGRGNRVATLDDPRRVPEDILKVSVYCPEGTAEPQAILGPRWGDALHMAAAGPDWVDFTLADKGQGLRNLCAALNVPLADTVAFGDNWNDAAMLSAAGTGYLMAGADPALLERFPHHCASVTDTLRTIVEELEG